LGFAGEEVFEFDAGHRSIFNRNFFYGRVSENSRALLTGRECVFKHQALGKLHLSVKVGRGAEELLIL